MCGIVGIADRSGRFDDGLLVAMRNQMSHRGPDGEGIWRSPDRRVGLAHRRLSIIDRSDGGAQPMVDCGGRFVITYNGEIYNYVEIRDELRAVGRPIRSGSDTEVLLEAYKHWGESCLDRFVGMFSFAIYDLERTRLFLARDRLGEKPLFYRHSAGRFRFASELKALLQDAGEPRRLNAAAFDQYLAYGYASGEACLLDGFRKLPPAHTLTYDLDADSVAVRRYWSPPAPAQAASERSVESLTDEAQELLLDSVRLQLRSDVPVGILLSGGLDSSLVAAAAARVSSGPVRTFTVSFPGHGTYDEAPHAALVAKHIGSDHTVLEGTDATLDLLPELVRQFDDPIADSSMLPTFIVSKLIREHATVALGGDGGDELFGGYTHYSWLMQQEALRRRLPKGSLRVLRPVAEGLPLGLRGRNYLIGLTGDLAQNIAQINLIFDRRARERLVACSAPTPALSPEGARARWATLAGSPLQAATRSDLSMYLCDDILTKVDRSSMLASLEARAPFLDHRLVEFAFAKVPDSLKVGAQGRKLILQRMVERLLPPEFERNRKQGFSIPLGSWLKGRWGSFIEEVLRQADPAILNQKFIQRLLEAQRRGRNNSHRLFTLAVFELWRREYRVSLG